MRFSLPLLAAAALLVASAASAATIEVQMLNKGAQGMMVFEPSFVQAQVGDVIHFVPTDAGHNVASIDGMLPEGAEAFQGDLGKEFDLTVSAEGLYGIKCVPHAGMGMVGLIQVGSPTNLDAVQEAAEALRGKAKERLAEDLGQVTEQAAQAE